MLRLSRTLRAVRNFYEVLGVSQDASTAEIKKAFREKVKELHPDTREDGANAEATKQYREVIDAYRVLRDETKRRKYDRDPQERAEGSDAFSQARQGGFSDGRPKKAAHSTDSGLNIGALTPLLLGGGFAAWFTLDQLRAPTRDQLDPYPRREPRRVDINVDITSPSSEASDAKVSKKSAVKDEKAEALVRAFQDPFTDRWSKIPDGYEPPSVTDLVAWHKQRIDADVWNNMYATGRLSEMVPRGQLKVRMRPQWETVEPPILHDPVTHKTVNRWDILNQVPRQQCAVQF